MMGFTGFKLMDQLTEAMTIATTAAMCLSTRAHDDFASTTFPALTAGSPPSHYPHRPHSTTVDRFIRYANVTS